MWGRERQYSVFTSSRIWSYWMPSIVELPPVLYAKSL